MLSLNLKYSDDPKYQHIADTLRALTYMFAHHIDIWLKLSDDIETISTGFSDLSASKFFNHLMQSDSETSELKAFDFGIVANTFIQAIKSTPILKRYVNEKEDAITSMWKFCKYFFCPVRLNDATVPEGVKINSLRRWLTTVFTLPFNKEYAVKFANLVKKYNYTTEAKQRFNADPRKVENFKQVIKPDFTTAVIGEYYSEGSFAQEFLRTFMDIVVLSSIDILKKYNPFIKEARVINPAYDGRWIMPFGDEMFSAQLRQLDSLKKFVIVK